MTALRLILADQLSESMPSLQGLDTAQDTVMLCEVMEEARYVPHHHR
jgi:deoxyribodipyrimidine photolyase-related protein